MQLKCKFYKRLKIEESDEANDDYVASDPTFLEDRGKSVIVAEAKYAKEGPDVKRTITQKRQYKRKKSINGPIVMETEDRPKKQPSSFPSLPGPKSTSLKTPCRIRVFYAHSINSKDMGKETLVPIIKTWTSGMLMKLEEKEFNIGRIEESAIQKWIVIESDDDVPVKDRMTSSKRKLRKNDTLESCSTQVFEDGNNHKEAPENVSDVENASYHFDSYQQSPPPTAQATSSQPLSPVAPLAKVSCLPQTDSDTLPVSSPQFGSICVQGYNVKRSVAPILEAIFKKHGDIAAKCQFKTASVRSNFLEVVCEVVTKIEADDVIEKLEELEGQVSDAEAANINVSWLRSHLEALHKRKGAMKLMEMNANTILVQSAAMMDLKEISEELMTVQERFEKAERCVRVLHLVRKNIENTISERKAETDSWVKRRIL
uniref:uncharacterized protein LOC122607554 isoform X3 n=1 Tax=Erigeron canadensis TaxID=72917 RepID=UPI001CB8C89F|nr:uncharacterized protein LOC122607554 isoform X3 [Erigeron canadensis]